MIRSCVATLLVVAACGGEATPSTTTIIPDTAVTTTTTMPDPTGTWAGEIVGYPVRLTLDSCDTVGAVCGELEYSLPDNPDQVLCASDLTLVETAAGTVTLSETFVYHPWECFPTTVTVRAADGAVVVEQSVEGEVCCTGTLQPAEPLATNLPDPIDLPGIGTATAVAILPGATTQYTSADTVALWLPITDTGEVLRLGLPSGESLGSTTVGDPGNEPAFHSDPHSVITGEAGVWVTLTAEQAVARIDPDTGEIIDMIAIDAVPYALALDGPTLWVTSFLDDQLVAIDLGSRSVRGRVTVSKPTGVAVGGGSVWVVLHRSDAVARIDPDTMGVTATIAIGVGPGPDPVCGRCIENIVYAFDVLWTADNAARTVTRIDPATNSSSLTVFLPHRVWSVAAGGGYLWASQFEENDPDAGGVVRLDPVTGDTVVADLDILGVFWGGDALWAIGPTRRGDLLYRISLEE